MTWVAVPGFESAYSVNEIGEVWSVARKKKMKQRHPFGTDYLTVSFERSSRYVHDLIAATFIGPRPAGMNVNHKDGIKGNNRPSNLEYVTKSENMKHAFRIGLQSNVGVLHSQAKLTDESVREIRSRVAAGEAGTAVARDMGLSQSCVSLVANGKRWAHVSQVLECRGVS